MSVYIRCDWLADGWHGLPGSISLGVVNHLEDEDSLSDVAFISVESTSIVLRSRNDEDEDEHVSSTKGVEIYAGPWAVASIRVREIAWLFGFRDARVVLMEFISGGVDRFVGSEVQHQVFGQGSRAVLPALGALAPFSEFLSIQRRLDGVEQCIWAERLAQEI